MIASNDLRVDAIFWGVLDLFFFSSDVTLVVDDTIMAAHRNVLSARSPYFKAMFSHKMSENLEGLVHIDEVAPAVFGQLLRFIYTGHCELDVKSERKEAKAKSDKDDKDEKDPESTNTHEMTVQLFAAADRFGVADLAAWCSERLMQTVNVANAAELLMLADKLNASELKTRVLRFLCADSQRRAKVTDTEAFHKLSAAPLKDLVLALTPGAKKRPREGGLSCSTVLCSHGCHF